MKSAIISIKELYEFILSYLLEKLTELKVSFLGNCLFKKAISKKLKRFWGGIIRKYNILALAGDGVGPEIMHEALRLLEEIKPSLESEIHLIHEKNKKGQIICLTEVKNNNWSYYLLT